MKLTTLLALSTALIMPIALFSEPAKSVTRIANAPLEAEFSGILVVGSDLFINYQHPKSDLATPFNMAAVGVISNADFTKAHNLADGDDKNKLTTSLGAYLMLISAGQNGLGMINGEQSDSPDFNAFISTGDNEGLLFSNWEETPGGMSRAKITRGADGHWSLGEATMIDFSPVNGTWINCGGSVTPWNTPLTSEELYFDDTALWNDASFEDFEGVEKLSKQLGHFPNPYDYGFLMEITDPLNTSKPVKHKAMGRFSHENGTIMPDQKTVYMGDDGTDTVFFKFVADKAGDLSAGTLFAAKIDQGTEKGIDVSKANLAITWIELGHSSNDEIAAWVKEYDGIDQSKFTKDSNNYITDAEIEAYGKGEAKDARVAFLESRKAAKAKGATAEFRKMENATYNGTDVFLAMTEISKGMSDSEGDLQLAENKCGAVFRVKLDANYNATSMEAFVVGGPYDESKAPNACSPDAVSSPDGVFALADGSILIGEDTSNHENNSLWIAK